MSNIPNPFNSPEIDQSSESSVKKDPGFLLMTRPSSASKITSQNRSYGTVRPLNSPLNKDFHSFGNQRGQRPDNQFHNQYSSPNQGSRNQRFSSPNTPSGNFQESKSHSFNSPNQGFRNQRFSSPNTPRGNFKESNSYPYNSPNQRFSSPNMSSTPRGNFQDSRSHPYNSPNQGFRNQRFSSPNTPRGNFRESNSHHSPLSRHSKDNFNHKTVKTPLKKIPIERFVTCNMTINPWE